MIARKVGVGVDQCRRKSEKQSGPYNNAERTGTLGQRNESSQENGENQQIKDDRKYDRRSRTDEMVDQIVVGVDEGTSEAEQVQISKAK